jgi:hypothetical protein
MTGGIENNNWKHRRCETDIFIKKYNQGIKNLSFVLRLSKPDDLEALQKNVHLYYSFMKFFFSSYSPF